MRFARKDLRMMGITKSWVVGEGGGEVGRLQWQVEKSASAGRGDRGLGSLGVGEG